MSSCTKCGYPVGNHPFRHPFAPVVAEGPKPPAPESPHVPLHCGVGDLGELRTRNAALLAEFERLRTEHRQMFDQLSDAESREGEALRILRAAVDWFDGEINAPWYAEACKLVAKADDERAAESITVPPNRTGTPEESQAIADWHHDEITRRSAESKAAKDQT